MSRCFTWQLKKCINHCIASLWRSRSLISLYVFLNILFRKLLDLIVSERYTNHFPLFSTYNKKSEFLSMIAATQPSQRLWITCWFNHENIQNIINSVFFIKYPFYLLAFKVYTEEMRKWEYKMWKLLTLELHHQFFLSIILRLTRLILKNDLHILARWRVKEN